MQQRIDEARLKRSVFTLLGVVVSIVLVFMAFRSQNPVFMGVVVGIPFLIPFLSRIDQLYVFMALAAATGFSVPGMSELSLALVFQAMLVGVCVLQLMMHFPDISPIPQRSKRAAIGLLLVIFVIMGVRGSGLRIFGSRTWGGTPYIYIILSILFLIFVVPRVRLARKHIKWIIFGGLVISVISSLMSRAGFMSRVAESGSTTVGASRQMWALAFAYAAMPVIASIKVRRFVRLGLMGFVVMVMAASGFRSRLVEVVAIFWLFEYFKAADKKRFFGMSTIAGLCAWVAVIAISPALPPGIQRAISFVPGARVAGKISQDAAGSIEWRVEIWKEAMSHFGEYSVIGRGVTFDVYGFVDQMGTQLREGLHNTLFGYLSHAYHSGPITMLIDFGIPGAVLFFLFVAFAANYTYGIVKRVMNRESFEGRYLLFLCVSLLWQSFSFWAVFGSANEVSKIIMAFSFLLVVDQSTRDERDCRKLAAG
jgi:hypothetical protein